MGTPYAGDPTVFPVSATAPDDGDPDDASHLNPTGEVALDRGAFLARRCLPDGVTTFAASCGSPSALPTNVPTPVDGETRVVRGYGTYIFIVGAAHAVDSIDCIAGTGGQWLKIDYLLNQPRLVQKVNATTSLGTPLIINGLTLNAPDPAGRVGGTVGSLVCSAGNFTIHAGDIFDISYTCPVGIPNTVIATTKSDVVVGVALKDASTGIFVIPSELVPLIENAYNQTLNPLFPLTTAANIGVQALMTRTARVTMAATRANAQGFALIVAEQTQAHAWLLADSVISVTQYRVTQ